MVTDDLIMDTGDEALVRKLHVMRAARAVLEHENRRWLITRIVPARTHSPETPTWSVYGRYARRGT